MAYLIIFSPLLGFLIAGLFGLFLYFKDTILKYLRNLIYGEEFNEKEKELNELKTKLKET